jgi:hypothetical protein
VEPAKRSGGCILCPVHPVDGGCIYRVNPTGERGIFACRDCYPEAERLWLDGKLTAEGLVNL